MSQPPDKPKEWYLVRKMLYLAVEDYKALVRKGVIKDGALVDNGGVEIPLRMGYLWGSPEVAELLEFFKSEGARAAFDIMGYRSIPLSRVLRAMEANAWNTKKQHFDDV
jgi:hypothetical protein